MSGEQEESFIEMARRTRCAPPVFCQAKFTGILWHDPRDRAGQLTCLICESVVGPEDYDAHVAEHNGDGWRSL